MSYGNLIDQFLNPFGELIARIRRQRPQGDIKLRKFRNDIVGSTRLDPADRGDHGVKNTELSSYKSLYCLDNLASGRDWIGGFVWCRAMTTMANNSGKYCVGGG